MRIFTFIAFAVLAFIWAVCDSAASSDVSTTNKQVAPYIYVSGAVREPGRYGWTNGMTVFDGIRAAGGFIKSAGRKIEIYHFARFQQTADGEVKVYGKAQIYDRGVISVTNQPPRLLRGDRIVVAGKRRIL